MEVASAGDALGEETVVTFIHDAAARRRPLRVARIGLVERDDLFGREALPVDLAIAGRRTVTRLVEPGSPGALVGREALRELLHGVPLVPVRLHGDELDDEGGTGLAQVGEAAHGCVEAARVAGDVVVDVRRRTVEGHHLRALALHEGSDGRGDERAVGVEGVAHRLARDVVEDLGEVVPEHGLAAGELPLLAAQGAGLVHDAPDLVEGELGGLVGRTRRQPHPAVAAGVVAPVGEVERAFEGKAGELLQD